MGVDSVQNAGRAIEIKKCSCLNCSKDNKESYYEVTVPNTDGFYNPRACKDFIGAPRLAKVKLPSPKQVFDFMEFLTTAWEIYSHFSDNDKKEESKKLDIAA